MGKMRKPWCFVLGFMGIVWVLNFHVFENQDRELGLSLRVKMCLYSGM